ncbi:site-specific integrase [Gloeobacter kilaueensis]|uniref:Phage integrase family protein n=1 Tax=Gloeobacter kilaueensis (strain ATCC BAA-2537 / CCAP 1431/1 / ULC 316 / JS1) TaxID=1183438 RepID=U5QHB4_GLOK1|nr:phage integrase family protein [Gloeobacter kilaueensis]AGY57024.1 phage integrase family protein [Gloeobacter kilaueensis JS1]
MSKPFEVLLKQANERLKAAACGLSIVQLPGTRKLYLRGILPPKPNSTRSASHQQTLATGLPASADGLKVAEASARKIASQIVLKEFRWSDWLKTSGEPSEQLTVHVWSCRFETDYFERRSRTPKTETTWRGDYAEVFDRLDQDAPLTTFLLREAIVSTAPDTRSRVRYYLACSALARFAGLDTAPLAGLKGSYGVNRTTERELPTDAEILQAWEMLSHAPAWVRWSFAMLACYGLRPHELYHLDLSELEAGGQKIRVLGDTKTGTRLAWPLVPDGFDPAVLRPASPPQTTGVGRIANQVLGGRVSTALNAWGCRTISAYSLRHAWAVRAIRRGLDVSAASRMMGHSLGVHNRTYQRWLSAEDLEAAWNARLGR